MSIIGCVRFEARALHGSGELSPTEKSDEVEKLKRQINCLLAGERVRVNIIPVLIIMLPQYILTIILACATSCFPLLNEQAAVIKSSVK